MGEVNVLRCAAAPTASTRAPSSPAASPSPAHRRRTGAIVVRPEFLRLLDGPGDAENVIEGELYNSYSLGSRQQYRVRAGDKVLHPRAVARQRRRRRRSTRRVLVGWDSRDALFVES